MGSYPKITNNLLEGKSQDIMMANNKKIIISTFLSTSQYLSFLICKTE